MEIASLEKRVREANSSLERVQRFGAVFPGGGITPFARPPDRPSAPGMAPGHELERSGIEWRRGVDGKRPHHLKLRGQVAIGGATSIDNHVDGSGPHKAAH